MSLCSPLLFPSVQNLGALSMISASSFLYAVHEEGGGCTGLPTFPPLKRFPVFSEVDVGEMKLFYLPLFPAVFFFVLHPCEQMCCCLPMPSPIAPLVNQVN